MPLPPHWDELRAAAWELPAAPGIYQFIGRDGKVLYIGKAKSLRDRVRNYFSNEALADAKRGGLLSESRSIGNILVSNEKEALALENNLIKQHKPKYNILLRDDKTYPYIKLTKEKYPRVYVTRRLKKDGSTYFGPYFPGNLAHRLVHFIHRHFKLPSCSIDLTRAHPRPCLEYHIHRCWGPCVTGLVSDDTYQRAAEDVRAFLGGRRHQLVRDLRERMLQASEDLEFEKAAQPAQPDHHRGRDHRAPAHGGRRGARHRYIRRPRGAAAGRRQHLPCPQRPGSRLVASSTGEDAADYDEAEFLASLLPQVYLGQRHVPALVRVQREFEGMAALAELLAESRGAKVEIAVPQRGSNRALLDLVRYQCPQLFRATLQGAQADRGPDGRGMARRP